jgi:uncharacterized membrane protein YheB (UPF0754 family)
MNGVHLLSLHVLKISPMNPWLYSIPFISAFIHWLTIWMALKLLFHPREPKRCLGFKLQGVFPKKQAQIAESLGRVVGRELLSFDEIERTITDPGNIQKILPIAEQHIEEFLRHRLKAALPVVSFFIGEKTIVQLRNVFMEELETLFPTIMKNYMGNLKNDLDLEKIVTEKISNLSTDKMEVMLNQIIMHEFRFVEVIGAGLGFLIGTVQILLTLVVNR